MTLGDRAWRDSLDHWLTTPPEEHQGWPDQPVCTNCDEELPVEPDRTEPGISTAPCTGVKHEHGDTDCGQPQAHDPHEAVMSSWTTEYRLCRNCGHENMEVIV